MADDVTMSNGLTYACPFSVTYLDTTVSDNVFLRFITDVESLISLNITTDVDAVTVYNEGLDSS